MNTGAKRRNPKKTAYALAAFLAVVVVAGAYFGHRQRAQARLNVETRIRTWFETPRLMAQVMMERYGPPTEITSKAATWHERGHWKRITVHGDSPEDCLEQTVAYRMTPDAVAPLRELDHGVRFDLAKDELSSRSSLEALNYLALNVADEVASGKRSAGEARNFYQLTARLATSGKSSPYLEGLLFKPYGPMPEKDWRREIGY